jgi:D-alanyl-lipoteichoic acid acyltransferase DltB (MBOAT superfamily)
MADMATPTRRNRPLLALMLLLTLFQAGAAVRSLQTPPALAATVRLPIALNLVMSLIWSLLAATVFLLLWTRRSRAPAYAAALLLGFILYSAARLALFTQADYDRGRLPVLVVVSLVLACIPGIMLLRYRRSMEND